MTNPSQNSKKKKITFSASEKGLEKAEKALVRLGFESKSKFAESQLLSRSTVTKFFNQQPIQLDSFKRICEALKLNWQEIAGIGEESLTSSQLERHINPSLGIEEGVVTVQTSVRQVIAVDERSQEIIAVVILEGDINSVQSDAAFFQEHFSKKYPGTTIKVVAIQKGSIRLIIKGDPKEIKWLLFDYKAGKLRKINNFPVQDIKILSESSEDEERSKRKWRLVEEIITNRIEGRELIGADLSDADLRNASLINANLSYADLSNADLSGANLSRANLSRANLSRTNLRFANLKDANLKGADLKGADLTVANLNGTDLRGADLSDTNLSSANLSNAYLRDSVINEETKLNGKWRLVQEIVTQGAVGRNLSSANLSGANLSSANLSGANLSSANLSSANLSSANLSGANLTGVYLNSANLSDANLSGVYLNSANLSLSDLSGADLSDADLSDANLILANLIGADLSDADLSDADLRGANLSGADLRGANVENARFSNNEGISEEMKQDLIKRGAIFEDSPGDRSFVRA